MSMDCTVSSEVGSAFPMRPPDLFASASLRRLPTSVTRSGRPASTSISFQASAHAFLQRKSWRFCPQVFTFAPNLQGRFPALSGGCARAAGRPVACHLATHRRDDDSRSEEHTSELQSLMRTSYAVFCL